MPNVPKPGTKGPNQLTKNEVVQMFAARAGGAQVNDVAKQFKVSPSSTSRILKRELRADVLIPKDIAEQVASMCSSRHVSPKKKQTVTVNRQEKALLDYTSASRAVITSGRDYALARERAVAAGFTVGVLDELYENLKKGLTK